MTSEKPSSYLLDSDDEMTRLRGQQDVLLDGIGSVVVPPIVWSKPDLRVLDSGTADGTCSVRPICPLLQCFWGISTSLTNTSLRVLPPDTLFVSQRLAKP